MSGGKKKSSFQITSVTTDYEGPGGSGGGDSPTTTVSTLPTPRLPNGEPSSELGGKGTPRNGSPPPGAPASRFRVVKLPQGLGEPYRRGRWTCVDIYERDLEAPGLSRLLEGVRGATGGTGGRSLDSRLELSSLGLVPPNPQPQGPTNWLRPPPTSPGLQARSFTGGLAQLAAGGKGRAETPPLPASPPQQHPPEPSDGDSTGVLLPHASTQLPTLRVEVEVGAPAMTLPSTRKKDGAPWLRKEGEERGQVRGVHKKGISLQFNFPPWTCISLMPCPISILGSSYPSIYSVTVFSLSLSFPLSPQFFFLFLYLNPPIFIFDSHHVTLVPITSL
ncbi:TSC22 domain family protein 4 [Petaurus breviceps papuanus]|uniref:TSC22 domain family protein 4 n=1 Tax=Petaurus breviceps papuanus TaxID=3040969 RepID=UPI0036D9EFFC